MIHQFQIRSEYEDKLLNSHHDYVVTNLNTCGKYYTDNLTHAWEAAESVMLAKVWDNRNNKPAERP